MVDRGTANGTVVSRDGTPLMHRIVDGGGPRTVFLGHSQPTHSGNLLPLAYGMADRGWRVHLGDLRGHGHSVRTGSVPAHLVPGTGWEGMRDDLSTLLSVAFADVPSPDRLIVAPNITALLTLDLLHETPDLAARIVLISPPPNQRAIYVLARAYVRARMLLHPVDRPDENTLHAVYSFLGAQLRTPGAMMAPVTADPATTEVLTADPLAWPTPTLGYWHEIFRGYEATWTRLRRTQIASGTEILVMSGGDDPMVANGRMIAPMLAALRSAGADRVTAQQVTDGRSGFFLEADRLNVAARIDVWARVGAEEQVGGTEDPEIEADLGMAGIAAEVLSTIGGADGPVGADALVTLCYGAIDDEARWIEVLYRLVHRLSLPGGADADELEGLLDTLMPHWDRSFRLSREIMERAAIGSVLQNVLERFNLGLAIVNDDFGVSYCNGSFKATSDALFGTDTPLAQVLPTSFLAQTRRGAREAVLVVDGRPVGFYFRPRVLRQAAMTRGGAAGVLALSLRTGSVLETRTERRDLVAFALGLTPRETEVAMLLAEGISPIFAADKLGISLNTLKTHLKRSFAKLEVTSQIELVSVMRSSVLDWARGSVAS